MVLPLLALVCGGAQPPTTSQSAPQPSPKQLTEPDDIAVHLSKGLVAYLPFDGDSRDESGLKNHATPHGVVEYGEGKIGQAVQLLGVEDRGFLTIKNAESLQFDEATTIACWFFVNDDAGQTGENRSAATTANAHQVLVAKHGDRTGFSLLTLGEIGDHRLLTLLANNGSPNEVGLVFPPDQPVGRWHHVATTAGDDGGRLYFNGVLVHSTRTSFDLRMANECDVFIGINGPASLPSDPDGFLWFPLNGAIDELRIYDRALTAREVETLAELEVSGANAMIDTSMAADNLPAFGAEQATGLPDTASRHEHASTAWSSETPDGQPEWLVLEYAEPVSARAVLIYETSNGGAVNKVSAFDADGLEVDVWTGHTLRTRPVGTTMPAALLFSIPVETNRVKIYVDSSTFPGFNQIDAVGLRDISGSVQWAVKATASSVRAPD